MAKLSVILNKLNFQLLCKSDFYYFCLFLHLYQSYVNLSEKLNVIYCNFHNLQ